MIGVFELLAVLAILALSLLFMVVVAFGFWRAGKRHAWRQLQADSPLCPRCAYDLRGQAAARCPECGATFTLGELWEAQRDFHDDDRRKAISDGVTPRR
ncbi:MAG: hypothetical protein H6816_15045 [Phycisphaerales bacterium]|nr:hypothetical protein [Phycisphaerales bacterium]